MKLCVGVILGDEARLQKTQFTDSKYLATLAVIQTQHPLEDKLK